MTLVRAGSGVRVFGNANLVANNILELLSVEEGFTVEGDYNVLRDNIALEAAGVDAIFLVSGTANTIDGNIAPPADPDQEAGGPGLGIKFTADGNYYGNNRMAVSLGGTVQTDWGGNVRY
jgi:hypothetical protein